MEAYGNYKEIKTQGVQLMEFSKPQSEISAPCEEGYDEQEEKEQKDLM